MQLTRRFTTPGQDPLDQVEYEKRRSIITNPDGSVVFEARDAEVPKAWSQLATDIVVSKYFRRAGVPTPEGRETSVRQLVPRVIGAIRTTGEQQGGYFDTPEDAQTFEDEIAHLLVNQMGAFNSPVWFNCGLSHAYGIKGSAGNWAWNPEKDDVEEVADSFARPQCSACFIQSVDDDLMSIFELVKTEARIFKYGSGTGTNFSRLRSLHEKLSGGGTSSGLMSFLEVLDRGAGATKSGGTTRRAAKMVCLDMDHPEIESFITWKAREEDKAQILIQSGQFPADFNGEAYHTVSGQNSNNSVRVSDEFMEAALNGRGWTTYARTTGEAVNQYDAADLLDRICESAWRCADPGVQFDTTINNWHTCSNTDKIRASNPCSEYMFLDDSACNLASINLLEFLDEQGDFDVEGFRHAVRMFILAQEILVDFSSYPTGPIARNSHDYRPLGLGYANLGAMLMVLGIPYDSPEGSAMCGAITALMTGEAYAVSAEVAGRVGAFPGYARNARTMMRVMEKHRDAVEGISAEFCPSYLIAAARSAWDRAIELGQKHGYRNAQVTVLAPTGTIGLLMDCDTTGIEPDFALVKFKKLAGGGHFKIVNSSVPRALRSLGYSAEEIQDILRFIVGQMNFRGAPHLNGTALKNLGLGNDDLAHLEHAVRGAMDLNGVFTRGVLGDERLGKLGIDPAEADQPGFSVLRALGFSEQQIEEANDYICGRLTIEGAPHLSDDHLPVFDCANRCGRTGRRYIAPMGHVRMMAAAQPFLSGAISKTVNLPNDATVDHIREIYVEGWRMGLKAIALYRDGCKMSQPLNTSSQAGATNGERSDDTAQRQAAAGGVEKPAAADLFRQAVAEAEKSAPRSVSIKVPSAMRYRLPQRRKGLTVEAKVAGHKVYLRTGEYEDGSLGEIFIDMHKEGAAFRSMMNCFAIAVSKGLQYGVPLKDFVDTFTFTRFEPQGMCDHPNIRMATSVIDYVFRVLALEYLGIDDYCQVKPEQPEADRDAVSRSTDSAYESDCMKRSETDGSGTIEVIRTRPAPVEKAHAPIASSAPAAQPRAAATPAGSALDAHMATMMGDAPMCDVCGHITQRNGTCYKCHNCGNSMGCS